MVAVKAFYDGKNYITEGNVAVKPNQRVIITYLDEFVPEKKRETEKKGRSVEELDAIFDSVSGRCHAWDGVDVLEYQRQLRGEYRENV